MMKPEGRVFLKSVFGQISDGWPCISFSRSSVGQLLRQEFVPGRDVVIYVGTSNKELTRNPDHRSSLIASVVIEPSQLLETRKMISSEYWDSFGNRWPLAMPVLAAASLIGPPFPSAREIAPIAYANFGKVENRGGIVEAIGSEREAIMDLEAVTIELHLSSEVQSYINVRASFTDVPKSVRQQATRMASRIIDRVKKGGLERIVVNPLRTAPNFSDLYSMLVKKWLTDQHELCALCGGPLVSEIDNEMLQPSADRIDSKNGAYDEENVQITHLACNLAKNQYGQEHFEEWLVVLRGALPAED